MVPAAAGDVKHLQVGLTTGILVASEQPDFGIERRLVKKVRYGGAGSLS